MPSSKTCRPNGPRTDWSVDKLDLDAYLNRIGYSGPREPSEATLTGLYRAHLAAIRFENLDVFLRGAVSGRLEAIQDKIVYRGRGGYCYEQAQLFGAVLERLGFGVERLLARVGPDGGPARAAHAPHAPGPRRAAGSGWPTPASARHRPRRCRLRRYRSGGPQEVDGWIYEVAPDQEHGEEVWKLREYQAGEWVTLHRWDDAKVAPGRRGPVQPLHVHAPGLVVHLAADHRQARPGRDQLDPRPHLHGQPPRPVEGTPRADRRGVRRGPHRRVRPALTPTRLATRWPPPAHARPHRPLA